MQRGVRVGTGSLSINLAQCKYEVVRDVAERLGYTVVGDEVKDCRWLACCVAGRGRWQGGGAGDEGRVESRRAVPGHGQPWLCVALSKP